VNKKTGKILSEEDPFYFPGIFMLFGSSLSGLLE